MTDSQKINSGEYIGISVLKIASIPHATILMPNAETPASTIIESCARDMSGVLSEIYQLYKEQVESTHKSKDIAIEILWATKPVKNQPYKASIDLFVSVRTIAETSEEALNNARLFLNAIRTTLDTDKYDVTVADINEYGSLLNSLSSKRVRAIVKDERVEDLQNQFLPNCYAYDILPIDYPELSRLVGLLIQTPNAAVAFQLMPTYFSVEELQFLQNTVQSVSMLSRGMSEQNIGSVSISAADRLNNLYRYYSNNKERSIFLYNILVFSDESVLSQLSSRVVGQINGNSQQPTSIRYADIETHPLCGNQSSVFFMPWVAADAITKTARREEIWETGLAPDPCYRLPFIITADEAAQFFRLPIATDQVSAGFTVNESSKTGKTYRGNIINAGDIEVGRLKSSASDTIGLSLSDLAKHMLIVGTPGSGKTTFSVSLLDRLWKEHHIPFLVIEPAKNEYRALIQSIPELQVFTPGKNFISPFFFNPFVPPKNVRLETYKSTLKTAFAAGVSMSTPLDKIFEDTVNNCYSDFRWLDTYTSDNMGRTFNITDFIKCFQETFDEIGYTGDARNIGRAGLVRLKSLTHLFDNYHSIPIEDILSKPTVIELAAIENADQKALIIALLLLSILAYVNANYVGEGGLRNFILLEEAHVLLAEEGGSGGEGAANPASIAQGLVKRMLAEIRSYGVGLGIADQSPRKVGTDIVALTDIKMVFRQVETTDKEIIANSSGMTDVHKARLAKLNPGEAFLFFNKLTEPEEVVTPDYRLENKISISINDESIAKLSTYWTTRAEKLRPYPECCLTPYCQSNCDFNRRVLAKEVARRIFKRYIGNGCKDIEKLKYVLSKIIDLIKAELNDEPFTRELLSCVKAHLWRKIRYETKLNISNQTINNSLTKK